MADKANTVYLKGKDKKIILPATDWSVVNGKPTNLATTDQLPQDTGWIDGSLLNGSTGIIQYRIIGHTIHLYGQIDNYPVDSGMDWQTTAFAQFRAFPDSNVKTDEISDWLSVDGNAKAQSGINLKKGMIKVYRLEGNKETMRFYKVYAID